MRKLEPKDHSLKHVAIIMDGNGRWAQARRHSRIWGHIRGSSIVSDIVEEADDSGVDALTLYAFSTENWSRPFFEVKVLFSLLKKFIKRERKRILKNQIRFKVIGNTDQLPSETLELISGLEDETKDFKGLKLTFAFGYGGRTEIVESINRFMMKNPGKQITEKELSEKMYLPDTGDVDLLIRTGGDKRISNFLLWQVAYAELFFTNTKWPEFSRNEFKEILDEVSDRERRFGSIAATESLEDSKIRASKNKTNIGSYLESSHV